MLFQFKRKWTCLLKIFVNHCGTGLLYVFYSNQSFRIRLIFDRALTIHIHFLKKVDNRFGLLIFPNNEQQKWIGIGVGICVLHCLTYSFGPPWYTRSQCKDRQTQARTTTTSYLFWIHFALPYFLRRTLELRGALKVTCDNGRWIPSDFRCFHDCRPFVPGPAYSAARRDFERPIRLWSWLINILSYT